MRLLRFAIAAICGGLLTAYVYEHRGPVEQLLARTDFWEIGVGQEAVIVQPDQADAEVTPIPVVPVSLPEPMSLGSDSPRTAGRIAAAPTVQPLEPVWQIVDAALTDAADRRVPVRTVSDSTPVPVATVSATTPAKATSSATTTPVKWEVIGDSAGNRPIHARKAGVGSDITLIVAGLDGEDRIAVKWVDQLSQRIDEAPELVADRQLILLRAVNPDGLTVKQSTNSHGVMLNRNFPTAAYRAGGQPSAGAGPASEPETRAVLKLLSEIRPQRIIHVQSSHKTAAISNTKSTAVMQSWQQALNSQPEAFNPQRQPGSLEDYAATVLGLEVVSLQLPAGDDWRSAGLTHVPTLLAMSAPISVLEASTATIALKDPATDHSLSASPFAPVDADESTAEPPRPVRKGYEELPPPPFKPNW